MPGPQFTRRPVIPEGERHWVLVTGPAGFDDRKHVWHFLDEYTLRLEVLEVLLISDRPRRFDLNGDPLGVTHFAYRWAEREWWTRVIADPEWYGGGRQGRDRAVSDVLGILRTRPGHKHCVAFYDPDENGYYDVMEEAREIVGFKNFKLVRC